MLPPDTDPAALAGLEIVDRSGERIGRVRQVYPDGGALGWAGVRGNLIGTTEALVPLADADLEDDVLTVPVTRARFLSAPRRTPDAPMDDEERSQLRDFYEGEPPAEQAPDEQAQDEQAQDEARDQPVGVRAAAASDDDEDRGGRRPLPARRATGPEPRPSADESEGIERREQRMTVTKEPVPRTRVVLRKVVVTEQRTVTVPVRREELRVVREPIEDAEAVPGALLQDDEQELLLHEERVVVTTEVVPVERIRLVREVVEEQREVSGEVWRERIVPGEEPAE